MRPVRFNAGQSSCSLSLFGFLFVFVFAAGCAVVDFITPEGSPQDEEISGIYNQTKLKVSSAADVMAVIYLPEFELLSQSKSVIASAGQKKKGYKRWFNMVAFDEGTAQLGGEREGSRQYDLTARRKYLFIVDEKPKVLFVEPWASLRFDSEMVLQKEVFDEPYADENAMHIAILKQVLANTLRDVAEVGSDNKEIKICGMLINQALRTVLVKLEGSPALASRLSGGEGLEFEHTSFGKGRIQMAVVDDVGAVKIRLGSLAKELKISFEDDVK